MTSAGTADVIHCVPNVFHVDPLIAHLFQIKVDDIGTIFIDHSDQTGCRLITVGFWNFRFRRRDWSSRFPNLT
jgi:hypothetical protein